MGLNLYHYVDVIDIARSLLEDEESLFEFFGDLTQLASHKDLPRLVENGYAGSTYQEEAISFLRGLADAMEKASSGNG